MVIFHSYVSLPEGTYEFKKKHSQFWRKWGPKHHQVEVDYWVHTIHGFGCQAFQHVLLLGVTATPWKNPSRLLRNSPVRRAGTYTMRGAD
jgi:hypothetical protein